MIENLFLEVLNETFDIDEKDNLIAYETLLDIFNKQSETEKIIEFYENNKDKISTKKGEIFVAVSYLDIGDFEKASSLMENIDTEYISDSDLLEKLAEFYLRTNDNDNALLIAEKGLRSENPTVFHGISYGLKNDSNLNLIVMKTGDINGDGLEENVLMMADDQGWGSEVIELFIQEGKTGNIIDILSISDMGGYPNGLSLADLNHDSILDILASVHSGGTGGMEYHYAYSFIDNNMMDLLETFEYGVDFEFLDGFKVEIFSEKINKAFEVEFDKERKDMYIEYEFYTNNGMISSAYGYFRGDMLEPTYIEELNKYGLKHSTSLTGPAYNADSIAWLETLYLYENGKWNIYDFDVQDEISVVKSIPFTKDRSKAVLADDLEKLDKLFSLTVSDLYSIYGEPNETGWYNGEYMAYDEILFYVYENKVTALSLFEGEELFGIKFRPRYNDIVKALGKPNSEEFSEYDGNYSLSYKLGKYYLTFFAIDKNSIYDIFIKDSF